MKQTKPPEACLIREFLEEIGVAVKITAALDPITHLYDHGQVHLHPFTCQLLTGQSQPAKPLPPACQWVRAETLSEYTFPPANDVILTQIRRGI